MRGAFLRSSHGFSLDKILPEKGRLTDMRMLIIAGLLSVYSSRIFFPGPFINIVISGPKKFSITAFNQQKGSCIWLYRNKLYRFGVSVYVKFIMVMQPGSNWKKGNKPIHIFKACFLGFPKMGTLEEAIVATSNPVGCYPLDIISSYGFQRCTTQRAFRCGHCSNPFFNTASIFLIFSSLIVLVPPNHP